MPVVACVLLFFSLLPFLPHYFRLSKSSVWIVSSGVMCVGLLLLAFISHLNEDGPKGFGAHSDQERILESELKRIVRFHYDIVADLARSQ